MHLIHVPINPYLLPKKSAVGAAVRAPKNVPADYDLISYARMECLPDLAGDRRDVFVNECGRPEAGRGSAPGVARQ